MDKITGQDGKDIKDLITEIVEKLNEIVDHING